MLTVGDNGELLSPAAAAPSWVIVSVLSVITVLCLLILLLFCYKEKMKLLSGRLLPEFMQTDLVDIDVLIYIYLCVKCCFSVQ